MSQTCLLVIHPKSAIQGSAEKLSLQWMMIGDWDGPLFILDDDRERSPYSAAANTYLEVVDVAIDERESLGQQTRLNADDEIDGAFEAALDRVLALYPDGDFILTGAWRDDCVRTAADYLLSHGRSVQVDDSAIAVDDID